MVLSSFAAVCARWNHAEIGSARAYHPLTAAAMAWGSVVWVLRVDLSCACSFDIGAYLGHNTRYSPQKIEDRGQNGIIA
jgi:hypothetical protein